MKDSPKTGEMGEDLPELAHRWKPWERTSAGEENLNCVIGELLVWTTVRVKNSRGSSLRDRETWYYEIYLQELNQIPIVDLREKSPWASSKGKGKETILQ